LAASVKSANSILADAKVISEVAAKRCKDADKMIDAASDSVGAALGALKGNPSAIKAATVIVNSLAALVKLFNKRSDKDGDEGETSK
jgi:hypothetical protein